MWHQALRMSKNLLPHEGCFIAGFLRTGCNPDHLRSDPGKVSFSSSAWGRGYAHMAVHDWPLGCTCCIGENGLHGAAGFTVLSKRTALTEEKRRPFLDPETPCFLTPPTPKDKLLRVCLPRGEPKRRETPSTSPFIVRAGMSRPTFGPIRSLKGSTLRGLLPRMYLMSDPKPLKRSVR